MLTVEQVKSHSEIFIKTNSPFGQDYMGDSVFTPDYVKCAARLCYLHNNRLSKLSVICPLPIMLIETDIENVTEEGISLFIEWQKFTDWINKHDDLDETNLFTSRQYSDYLAIHRHEPRGRNGTLDLVRSVVVDHNKTVLV